MTKLEEAKRRWGMADVKENPQPFTPAPRGVAVAFSVGRRVSRVTEQRRDISAFKLDRSTTP